MVDTGIDYAAEAQRELDEFDRRIASRQKRAARCKDDGTSVVYSVRLDAEMVADVEGLAERLAIRPSNLVRGFVREGLAAHRRLDVPGALDRIEADVAQLRRALAGQLRGVPDSRSRNISTDGSRTG